MIPAPVGHQCPECVAEARREYRQGPGRQVAVANLKATPVTKILLIAIGIGYLWELAVAGGPGSLFEGPGLQDLIDAGALVPFTGVTAGGDFVGGILGGEWWRLLSSIFLHAGLIHLGLNAYVLWIFGVEIERQIGRLFTLAVFLVTGVFAGAVSFAFAPGLTVGVGASGAIFGLVGAFIAYNYLRRHHVMAQARLRWRVEHAADQPHHRLHVAPGSIGERTSAVSWRAWSPASPSIPRGLPRFVARSAPWASLPCC